MNLVAGPGDPIKAILKTKLIIDFCGTLIYEESSSATRHNKRRNDSQDERHVFASVPKMKPWCPKKAKIVPSTQSILSFFSKSSQ